MPINTDTVLVIGRGRLYFAPFLPGTFQTEGEFYIGNTPGFSVGRSVEEIDRFRSYAGQRVKMPSDIISEIYGANIVFDSMKMENMTLWFGGNVDTEGQAPVGFVEENFIIKKGRVYQLGSTVEPIGARHIATDIKFRLNGILISPEEILDVNLTEGRFTVLADADVNDGSTLNVVFQWRRSKRESLSVSPTPVNGELRFIGENLVGPRTDYFFPSVSIKPQGTFDLKGDLWQQAQLSVDILKKNPLAEFVYVSRIGTASFTADEEAIINTAPMPLEEFPYWEDELNTIININIPAADYGQPIP